MALREHVVADYQTHRLSLKAHPMQILRPIYEKGIKSQNPKLSWRKPKRTLQARELFNTNNNAWVTVAGVVLVRQRPGTAKGVVFITIEDETGTANIVVWSKLMAKYRRTIMSARLLAVRGKVQREGDVIHVVAQELFDRTHDLDTLSDDEFELQFANADHVVSPLPETSSAHRKLARMAARGETAEGDVADVAITPWSEQYHGSKNKNANMVTLSRADEVLHPQDDRKGLPVHAVENGKVKKIPVVNQGRHPRNVRIIPKSRDFH
jgi:error-prone DNA polymerase